MMKCAEQFKTVIKFNFLSSSHHVVYKYDAEGCIELHEHRGNGFGDRIYQEINTARNVKACRRITHL